MPELVRRSFPCTVFVPVDVVGRSPEWGMESSAADATEEVMTAEELASLPSLVELGSHTLTHPHLTQLGDAELREEVTASRLRLAELASAPVTLLAFPYGDHDDRVVGACREAGYDRVFAIEPRLADPLGRDFVRGRVMVDPADGLLVFFLKSRGAYRWMTQASAIKGRLLRGRRGS